MSLEHGTEARRLIEVVEDTRTSFELYVGMREKGLISGLDLNDLAQVTEADAYIPTNGKRHTLTLMPSSEISIDKDISVAKLLVHGRVAGFMQYPLLAAFLAVEACAVRELGDQQIIFAHTPVFLPRLQNMKKTRHLTLSVFLYASGRNKVIAMRVKHGNTFRGSITLAFGVQAGFIRSNL